MNLDEILDGVRLYYTDKLQTYGATPQGADWNSVESQELRFEQLLKVCDHTAAFSINDYGCGYGGLADYMTARGYRFRYQGFDISEAMIAKGRELHKHLPHCEFVADESAVTPADYTLASGLFNVKLEASRQEWEEYVLSTLGTIARLSEKGFSFNALTKYSDPERMRSDLYYADPLYIFDYCKSNLSKSVALLHDYPLYEFTILVRLQRGAAWQT